MADEATNIVSLVEQGKYNKAEEVLLRWMDKNPNDFHALCNYVDMMMRKANYGLAVNLYRYLLKEWPDMPSGVREVIWSNIGQCLLIEGFNSEAEYAFNRAIEINDKHPAIFNAMAACYINQAQPDKVIEYCNKALGCDPNMPQALWNRAVGYLEKSEWHHAWEGYEHGDRIKKQRTYHEGRITKQWSGKRGRTVVVWGEQGIGDEVMFMSCLPDLMKRVKSIILDCHPRLEKLFKRSFPGIPVYGTRKDGQITWHHKHQIDEQLSVASMPQFFRRSAESFPGTPYLKADPERTKFYRDKLEALGPGPYVGIAWFGGEKKTRFDYRAIPIDMWRPLIGSGGQFVSIQYNKWGHKRDAVKLGIQHWDQPVDDLDEQAALIMACDLIVSVCQTLVHFSGALGRKCWCLTPARPAWRYGLTSDHMAWYGNTVTLIRQKEGETWQPAMDEARRRYLEYKETYDAAIGAGGIHGVRVDGSGGLREMEGGAS